jgi:hypothetical protein
MCGPPTLLWTLQVRCPQELPLECEHHLSFATGAVVGIHKVHLCFSHFPVCLALPLSICSSPQPVVIGRRDFSISVPHLCLA